MTESFGIATANFAVALIALALNRLAPLACVIMFIIGANWVVILTNFNVATQLAVPAWVKGRAMSLYLLTLWGSMAGGSALWGTIAKNSSAHSAMLVAAAGVILGLMTAIRFRLIALIPIDFTPAFKGAAPARVNGGLNGGPVHVAVAYQIDSLRTDEFLHLMHELRPHRLRNGARRWALRPGEAAGEFTERFSFVSAAEYALQKSRTTRTDLLVEERVLAMHVGGERPVQTTIDDPIVGPAGLKGDQIKPIVQSLQFAQSRIISEIEICRRLFRDTRDFAKSASDRHS